MYSASFFIPSPGEKHFKYYGNEALPITTALVKTDVSQTVLTLSCPVELIDRVRPVLAHEACLLIHYTANTLSIIASLEQFDKLVVALHKLKSHRLIPADFAQKILDNYPDQRGGVMQWSPAVPETETMSMDMNVSDDEEENEPRQAFKRPRFND